MMHIYAVRNSAVAHKRSREMSIAQVNLLRKFEGKMMIEERIDEQMGKLHSLWFKKAL